MRRLVLAIIVLGCSTSVFAARPANYNAFQAGVAARGDQQAMPIVTSERYPRLIDSAHPISYEPRLAVPTFLWTTQKAAAVGSAPFTTAVATQVARRIVEDYAEIYRLNSTALAGVTVDNVRFQRGQPTIVRFRQDFYGIEVFSRRLNVLLNSRHERVAISGYLSPYAPREPAADAFALSPMAVITAALRDLGGRGESLRMTGARNGYFHFRSASTRIRVQRVYFLMPNRLVPAYYMEVDIAASEGRSQGYYACVYSAKNGDLLYRRDLRAMDGNPYTYRVWADVNNKFPLDGPANGNPNPAAVPGAFQPTMIPQNFITTDHGPIRTRDSWLPTGSSRSHGNNVDVYVSFSKDEPVSQGFTPSAGDFRAAATGVAFDYPYDSNASPTADETQQQAAIVNAFYVINSMHDFFHDGGFDEAADNAQQNNYGRGGAAGDPIWVEIQDPDIRNNAWNTTPADGASPKIEVGLFRGDLPELEVATPAAVRGNYSGGYATFGPQSFEVSGKLVMVDDGTASSTDACEKPLINASDLVGNIAVIDRGACPFADKTLRAQQAGAIAVIIVNNVAFGDPSGTGGIVLMGGTASTPISISAMSLSLEDGKPIEHQLLGNQVVTATMNRQLMVVDGALDNTLLEHEWGHTLVARLIPGISNQQGNGMNEGWADFIALLMTIKPQDAPYPGVYTIGPYASSVILPDSWYFGFRRYPYSIDMTKNPLTFKHISDGVALPEGVPLRPNRFPNSEVHNTGEVWASALLECYVVLLNDSGRGFTQARAQMRDYLVASLQLTPTDPTFTEARDALIAVAAANSATDAQLFMRAFAKRGLGADAQSPPRYADDNHGVVESFTVGTVPLVGGGGANAGGGGGRFGPFVLLILVLAASMAICRRHHFPGTVKRHLDV